MGCSHTHHVHIVMGIKNHALPCKVIIDNIIKIITGEIGHTIPRGVPRKWKGAIFLSGNIILSNPNYVQPGAHIFILRRIYHFIWKLVGMVFIDATHVTCWYERDIKIKNMVVIR